MGEREREGDTIPAGTHCEWCGADFEKGAGEVTRKAAAPPPAPVAVDDEPATHCEWCGAEYPVPGRD